MLRRNDSGTWTSVEKVDTKCIIDEEVFRNDNAIHARVSGRGGETCA